MKIFSKVRNLLNSKGFTLTEVVIGGAIVLITGLGVMKGLEVSSDASKLKRRSVQADRLHRRIVGQLAIRATCKATFDATNTPATVDIYPINGSVIGGEFSEVGINSVTIPAVAASPNVQTGQLVIVYNLDVNNRGIGGGGQLTKTSPIYIRRTTSNFECSTAFLDEESYRQNCLGSGGTWDSDTQTCNINTGSGMSEILSAASAAKKNCSFLTTGQTTAAQVTNASTALKDGIGCNADESMCEGVGGCWDWDDPATAINYPGCSFPSQPSWGYGPAPLATWSACTSCNRERQQQCQSGTCSALTCAPPQPLPEVVDASAPTTTPVSAIALLDPGGVTPATSPAPTCAYYSTYDPTPTTPTLCDSTVNPGTCYKVSSCLNIASTCGGNCDPASAIAPLYNANSTEAWLDVGGSCGPAGTWPATIPGASWSACSSCSETATISCNLGACGGTCPTANFNIGSASCVPNGAGTSATCTQSCDPDVATWETPSYPACPAIQTDTIGCNPTACGSDCTSINPLPAGCFRTGANSGTCNGAACVPPGDCVNGASCPDVTACTLGSCSSSSSTTCTDYYAGPSTESCLAANASTQLAACNTSCGVDPDCSCVCLGGFSYGPMDSCSGSIGWPGAYVGGFHIRKMISSTTPGICSSCPACTPTTSCAAIAATVCTGTDAGNDSCGNACGNGTKTDGACSGGSCTAGVTSCNSDADCGGAGGNCNIASCNTGDSCTNDSNCTGGASCLNIPITTPGDCSISVTGCVGSSYNVGPGGCTPGSSCNTVECGQYGMVSECVDCSCGGDVTTDNYTCQNCPTSGTCSSCAVSCTPNCSNASNVCAGVSFDDGCGGSCTGTKSPTYGTWSYGGWGSCIGSNENTWGTETRTSTCTGVSNGCGVTCPGSPDNTRYCMDLSQWYSESMACSAWNVCCDFTTPQPWSGIGSYVECRTIDGVQDAWCDNAPEGPASLYECRLMQSIPTYP